MPENRTVLSDVGLVRRLVDSLCYSKGGPLPDWDDVYEEHCGATGELIDERPDLGCLQLSFPDGHKYWYPSKAVCSMPPADLKSSIKIRLTNEQILTKMMAVVDSELGPAVVDDLQDRCAARAARAGSSPSEEWHLFFQETVRHLSHMLPPAHSPTTLQRRASELEVELAETRALLATTQKHREDETRRLEQRVLDTSSADDAATAAAAAAATSTPPPASSSPA
eukprot:Rhum_TRINITY_DN23095_c0_g1::Rhum_TRINITY_DN23095_c0_g1_i1::g.177088::m.177088